LLVATYPYNKITPDFLPLCWDDLLEQSRIKDAPNGIFKWGCNELHPHLNMPFDDHELREEVTANSSQPDHLLPID
jgi:hypothetical protein